jgi:hypothetical protein
MGLGFGKRVTSRLTKESHRLLAALAKKRIVNQAAVTELVVREAARKEVQERLLALAHRPAAPRVLCWPSRRLRYPS